MLSFKLQFKHSIAVEQKFLKNYDIAEEAIIRWKILLEEGFNEKYFTHYLKIIKGDNYLFINEYVS
jgi:hypothetical protein